MKTTKKKPAKSPKKKPTARRLDLRKTAPRSRPDSRSSAKRPAFAGQSADDVFGPDPRRSFEQNGQALIAGVAPLPDVRPGDDEPTVQTIRTTKGEVRRWQRAATLSGHTFAMPWALHVLRLAAAARIAEAGRS